ncbi:MAG: hypothetical protein NT027_17470 [Proteobacteria bacterium]|nr:hypothetical protein [Pseudomonadota bacterium]
MALEISDTLVPVVGQRKIKCLPGWRNASGVISSMLSTGNKTNFIVGLTAFLALNSLFIVGCNLSSSNKSKTNSQVGKQGSASNLTSDPAVGDGAGMCSPSDRETKESLLRLYDELVDEAQKKVSAADRLFTETVDRFGMTSVQAMAANDQAKAAARELGEMQARRIATKQGLAFCIAALCSIPVSAAQEVLCNPTVLGSDDIIVRPNENMGAKECVAMKMRINELEARRAEYDRKKEENRKLCEANPPLRDAELCQKLRDMYGDLSPSDGQIVKANEELNQCLTDLAVVEKDKCFDRTGTAYDACIKNVESGTGTREACLAQKSAEEAICKQIDPANPLSTPTGSPAIPMPVMPSSTPTQTPTVTNVPMPAAPAPTQYPMPTPTMMPGATPSQAPTITPPVFP